MGYHVRHRGKTGWSAGLVRKEVLCGSVPQSSHLLNGLGFGSVATACPRPQGREDKLPWVAQGLKGKERLSDSSGELEIIAHSLESAHYV